MENQTQIPSTISSPVNVSTVSINPSEVFKDLGIELATFQDIKQEVEKVKFSNEYTIADTIEESRESFIDAINEIIDNEEIALPELPSQIPINTTEQVESDTQEESEYDKDLNIKENPKSILVKEETSRFSSAEWYDEILNKKIMIAGVGGIGSFTAFMISRLSPEKILLFDNDRVEASNISGQLYSASDIRSFKVDAIQSFIRNYSNYFNTLSLCERYTENNLPGNIMICGFDNMESRKVYFNSWKKGLMYADKKSCLFIDGRLNAEEFQVFCITGDDDYNIKRYEDEYLFSNEEAEGVECSYKQTTYCACMIGSIITNLLVNFISNYKTDNFHRDLPFKTYYNASIMYLKTEK